MTKHRGRAGPFQPFGMYALGVRRPVVKDWAVLNPCLQRVLPFGKAVAVFITLRVEPGIEKSQQPRENFIIPTRLFQVRRAADGDRCQEWLRQAAAALPAQTRFPINRTALFLNRKKICSNPAATQARRKSMESLRV